MGESAESGESALGGAIADEIGVIAAGALQQWSTPYDLYHEPRSRFVADFIGQGIEYRTDVLLCEAGVVGEARDLDAAALRQVVDHTEVLHVAVVAERLAGLASDCAEPDPGRDMETRTEVLSSPFGANHQRGRTRHEMARHGAPDRPRRP